MNYRMMFLAGIFASTAVGPARAIDPAAGTGGASFMKIGIGSARAMALGRAYVALAEGTDALNWNPAGLAMTQQRELSYGYTRHFQDINSPFYMAYAHPLGRTVLAVNGAYLGFDAGERRDSAGLRQPGDVRVQDGFATVGVGRSFWYEKIFLGASIKNVIEDNAGTRHNVMAGDFGAMFRPNSAVTFGFANQNFGANKGQIAGVRRLGVAVKAFDLLTFTGEGAKADDAGWRLGLGGEFMLPEDLLQVGQIYLRMGYYSADDLGQVLEEDRSFLYPMIGSPKLSFGLGMFTAQAFGYGINVDYTLVSYGSLGTADMMQVKVKF